MFNPLRKDKKRRIMVKSFEIDRLHNKAITRAISFLDQSLLQSFFKQKLVDTSKRLKANKPFKASHNTFYENTTLGESSDFSDSINSFTEEMKSSWKRQAIRSTPRNSSRVRIRNRCIESGRGRAVLKFCKLSRIRLRLKGSQGLIPGLRKASW